jgi:hypothetical protein
VQNLNEPLDRRHVQVQLRNDVSAFLGPPLELAAHLCGFFGRAHKDETPPHWPGELAPERQPQQLLFRNTSPKLMKPNQTTTQRAINVWNTNKLITSPVVMRKHDLKRSQAVFGREGNIGRK